MMSFADEVAASLPRRVALPPEWRLTFDWMEANHFVFKYSRGENRYAAMHPADINGQTTSIMAFHAADPAEVLAWTRGHPEAAGRLAMILRTGGDGSKIGLWLDDLGRQSFVHLGSGSGSVLMCRVTSDPVDVLRLLAIGYDELCWPEYYPLSVPAVWKRQHMTEGMVEPLAFRTFVETTFGVQVPATASAIITSYAQMDDAASADPFWRWMKTFDAK